MNKDIIDELALKNYNIVDFHQKLFGPDNEKTFEQLYDALRHHNIYDPISLSSQAKPLLQEPAFMSFLSTNDPKGGSFLYRSIYIKEQVENRGSVFYSLGNFSSNQEIIHAIISSTRVILIRPTLLDIKTALIIKLANLLKIKIIIDCDDILSPQQAPLRGGSLSKSNFLKTQITSSRSSVYPYVFADKATVSTPKIKETLSFIDNISILKNKLPPALIKQNIKIPKINKKDKIHLIYPSGTDTHNHDFSFISLALHRVMKKYPQVHLSFIGTTQSPRQFLYFKERIKIYPLLPFEEMLEILSEKDILLVPLHKNIFNDGKSAIKYIEAGAVGTATIATATDEFKDAIRDGENGFLVHHPSHWFDKLSHIIENPEILCDISKNAYHDVKKNHTTANIDYVKIYNGGL